MKIAPIILSVFVFISLCVFGEFGAGLLIANHAVKYYQPLDIIQQHADSEDWRLTMSFNEHNFVFDPVLFWKRSASVPSSQETLPATASCTMLTYGDSNTQGIGGSWPAELQNLFVERNIPIQVMNVGTMGYSSYQGISRYKSEASQYSHSIILVSFGWNDATPNMQVSDKKFSIYLSSFMRTSSLLMKSNLFRIIKYYSDAFVQSTLPAEHEYFPRVSLEEYKDNLEEFIAVAKKNGSQIVFVTRPYVTNQIMGSTDTAAYNWRSLVPIYNELLLRVAGARHIPVIDLQKLFEEAFGAAYFVDDNHFTKAGYVEAANIIASELLKNDIHCRN